MSDVIGDTIDAINAGRDLGKEPKRIVIRDAKVWMDLKDNAKQQGVYRDSPLGQPDTLNGVPVVFGAKKDGVEWEIEWEGEDDARAGVDSPGKS